MKIVRAGIPAGTTEFGGYSGIPSWRRKWIENKVRWVELECGCIEDISIPVLTFINTFEGTSVDCIKCGRFSAVKRTVKRKYVTIKYPQNPLF